MELEDEVEVCKISVRYLKWPSMLTLENSSVEQKTEPANYVTSSVYGSQWSIEFIMAVTRALVHALVIELSVV
jgi:hypothetical protein